MTWKTYPKTELHIHIEGAATPDFILGKAKEKKIDVSLAIDGETYQWADFEGFLKTYEETMKVLTTPQDFHDLALSVLSNQAANGVKYTELTLGPVLMCDNDPGLWREMMDALERAADAKKDDIETRFTGVIVRHFGVERAEETAALVARNGSPRLTGFGMAGAEIHLEPKAFQRAFEIAKEAGLGLTCHAGEWGGAELIEQTIDALGVTRLGHGVRASESANLMAKLKDLDIHCETCPGSNVSLGVYPDWASHPVRAMNDLGVSVSISSDDPPYFHTTMTREYEELAHLGWGEKEFAHSNREAMRHAFCDEDTKRRISANWR